MMVVVVGMVMVVGMIVVVMVVIVHVVMLMIMVMDVVMYVEMGDGVLMPMIVFMVIMVMIVVMVVVVVVPLLLAVDGHRHVGARDAAGHRRLRRHADAGEPQTVHFLQEGGLLLLTQELEEGGGEHVPGAPHSAFNVKGFHVTVPPVLPFD